MAVNIGELVWKIKGDTTDIDKSLKKTGTAANKFGQTMNAAFSAVAVIALGRKILDISKVLISISSDAQETRQKFNVVFADVADAATSAADDIAASYGLSQQASENYLSGVGDIVSGLGATSEEALLVSDTITRLGVDIDSFANLSGGAEQAVSALTSLFTGEREAAKALGIVINDTNLKQYAEDTGRVFAELTQLEKGFLSLELAQQQSTLAIGDFARSQDSFANQTRIAESAVLDLQAAIGDRLLPTATSFTTIWGLATRALADFIEERNKLLSGTEVTTTSARELMASIEDIDRLIINAFGRNRSQLEERRAQLQAALEDINVTQFEIDRISVLRAQGAADYNAELEETARLETERAAAAAAAAIIAAEQAILEAQRLETLNNAREFLVQSTISSAEARQQAELAASASIARSELERIDTQREAEEALAAQRQQALETGLASFSSYASSVAGIFSNLIQIQLQGNDELTEKQKKNVIALYRVQQAANIAQVTVDTAAAIARQYKDLPIWAAIPASIITGAVGAAQIALIAATPPPQMAQGGIVPARPGGTQVILGEAGEDEIVTSERRMAEFMGGSGGRPIILQIDTEVLARWMQGQLDNRGIVVPEGSVV